jgi:hypothetical protein
MNHYGTRSKHTADAGALVIGAWWSGSGIAPAMAVEDSLRPGLLARVGAISLSPFRGVANIKFALASAGH